MNLSCKKAMRAYRKGGRLFLILRLELPCTEEEGHGAFNSFYKSVSDAYTELAASLCEDDAGEHFGALSISVSFAAENAGGLLKIQRVLSFKGQGKELECKELDFYNEELDAFVKPPKSIKKQRFLPSRKGKKHKKTD